MRMKSGFNPYVLGTAILMGVLTATATAKSPQLPSLDTSNFDSPQDNTYWPMAPGATYVYMAEEDGEVIIDEITTTAATKDILGVTCKVISDVEQVYIEDLDTWFVTEATEDWYAWDNDGNVWYFGEETVEYIYDEEWNLVDTSTAGSWEAGVDGAQPGIVMQADPKPGMAYRQEYYEGEAEDVAKVLRLNASVEVEYGEFEGCLVTKEWTALSPGVVEKKFYAPGVGLVFVEELKGKTVQVELIDIL